MLVLTGMTESEGHDRTTLGIDPQSLALLQAVHAQLSTVPKILVIVSGGAVSTEEAEPVRPAFEDCSCERSWLERFLIDSVRSW